MKALDNLTINQKYGLVLKEDIEKTNCVISEQKQQIERLQEQLKEANEIILKLGKWTYVASDGEPIRISKYIKKWGVK